MKKTSYLSVFRIKNIVKYTVRFENFNYLHFIFRDFGGYIHDPSEICGPCHTFYSKNAIGKLEKSNLF